MTTSRLYCLGICYPNCIIKSRKLSSVETSVGMELDAKVYPNPTVDYLILETNLFERNELYCPVIDISGNVLYYGEFINNLEKIDLSVKANGVFYYSNARKSKN